MRSGIPDICDCEAQDKRPDHSEDEFDVAVYDVCNMSETVIISNTARKHTLRTDVCELYTARLNEFKSQIDVLRFLYAQSWILVVPTE